MQSLTQPCRRDVGWPAAAAVKLRQSDDLSYATGLHTGRYPMRNPHIVDLLSHEFSSRDGSVLDFGGGCHALSLAQSSGADVFASDISAAATLELDRQPRKHR